MEIYDFIIIGTGPAGVSAAMTAAKRDKQILVVEKEGGLGGVCVNTGTFPSKTLREAVLLLTGHMQRQVFEDSACIVGSGDISMDRLQRRLQHVRLQEHAIIDDQLERNGVRLIRGAASFVDDHTVSIDAIGEDEPLLAQGKSIIIATGSRPRNPPEIPFDGRRIVDSRSILDIAEVPKSMIILGGGVIGSEYATIFAALGVKVTLLDRGQRLLKFVDHEITDQLQAHFPKDNLEYLPSCGDFTAIAVEDDKATISLADGRVLCADVLFFALGREANVDGLGLERTGVRIGQGHYITVNDLYQTSVDHIYAVGDVIGWPSLAATSIIQGRLAALNAMQRQPEPFPRIFPVGIYTIPEISYVGLTEEEARERDYKYVVGRCLYKELPRGQISGECEGVLKMLVHSDTREILGVHIFGGGATEIIHTALMALCHNAKIDLFIENIFNFPTYSEALKIAALSAYNKIERNRKFSR
ncbi:MAG: Si-specific NAD(P)(+) transhydrogenase [Desulfopila sp.]